MKPLAAFTIPEATAILTAIGLAFGAAWRLLQAITDGQQANDLTWQTGMEKALSALEARLDRQQVEIARLEAERDKARADLAQATQLVASLQSRVAHLERELALVERRKTSRD